MTPVAFHFGVPDKLSYACRLLRKARQRGARITVSGAPAALARLDTALWTFEALAFLPHCHAREVDALAPRLRATPILLLERVAGSPATDVLVNLGPDVVEGHEGFARLIELVSVEAEDRAQARARWRRYESLGMPIERHEVAA